MRAVPQHRDRARGGAAHPVRDLRDGPGGDVRVALARELDDGDAAKGRQRLGLETGARGERAEAHEGAETLTNDVR